MTDGTRRSRTAAGLFVIGAILSACCPSNTSTGTIETKFFAAGPWAVTYTPSMFCCDSKNNAVDVFYPTLLGHNGFSHPVLTWGNGSFGTPDRYRYFLEHLASWGFVVVATRDEMTGSGKTMLDALDQLRTDEQRPASAFHNKLSFDKLASLGHSQGAGRSLNALVDSTHPILTAIPIELPAHAWCLANLPNCADASKLNSGSVFFVDGSADVLISPPVRDPSVAGQESIAGYYAAVPAGIDKLKGTLLRADHNDIQGRPGCTGVPVACCVGVNGYLGYITAWLRTACRAMRPRMPRSFKAAARCSRRRRTGNT